MVASTRPADRRWPAAPIEQHDGVGIRWRRPWAPTWPMDATEVAIFIEPQQLVRGILVNARGQRYVAEDTYPGRIGQLTLPPGRHRVPDHRRRRPGGGDGRAVTAPDDAAADLGVRDGRRVETEIGLPPARCRPRSTTTTPVRPAARIRCCIRRPSGCVRSAPRWVRSTCATAPGLHPRRAATTLSGEVLHVSGEPIPGLFAAGAAPRAWPRVMPAGLTGRRQLLRPSRWKRRRPRLACTAGLLHSLFRRTARTTRCARACDSRHRSMIQKGIFLLVICRGGSHDSDCRNRHPSAVIDRVSLVLDAFDGPGRLTLAQIVRRTGLPRSSAHRMLERLVQLRWLRRSGRDAELGDASCRTGLAGGASGPRAPRGDADAARTASCDRSGGPPGGTGRRRRRTSTRSATGCRRDPDRVGGRHPAHCTAVGKAIMAA